MTTIYKHTCIITDKSYIGQTIFSMEVRLQQHIKNSKSSNNNKFYNAIRKYGINSFISEIIGKVETASDIIIKETLADTQEKYWIKYYNTLENGYNSTEGGGGILGYKHSDLTKSILSEKSKINTKYFWNNENNSERILNMRKPKSEIGRNNIAISNKLMVSKPDYINGFEGKSHSDKNKSKAVNNRKINNDGDYHPNGNRTAKTFIFISPEGIEHKVFNSSSKFCKEQGINVKIFRRFPNQIIERGKSKGWKRTEI